MRATVAILVDADVLFTGDCVRASAVVSASIVFLVDASGLGLGAISAAGVLTTIFSAVLAARISLASVLTFPSAARMVVDLTFYLGRLLLLLTLLGSVTPVR